MSAQHTPGEMIAVGRWVENIRDDKPDLVTSDGIGGDTDQEQCANARRIAACWGACKGISTDDLETTGGAAVGWTRTASKLMHVTTQRDDLLAALSGLLAYFESGNSVPVQKATINADSPEVIEARAALTRAEGGAQ